MKKLPYKLPPLHYDWRQELTIKKIPDNLPSFAHLIYIPPAGDGWVKAHPSYSIGCHKHIADLMPEWLRADRRGAVKMLVGGAFSKTATTDMAHLTDTDHYNWWLGSIDAVMAAEQKNWWNGTLIDAGMADKGDKLFYTMLFRWRWFGVIEVFAFAEPDMKTHSERISRTNETLIPELLKLYVMEEARDLSREKALLDMRKQLSVG
jgi:hypothetical protein